LALYLVTFILLHSIGLLVCQRDIHSIGKGLNVSHPPTYSSAITILCAISN
jgi:hypothetical protein